MNDAKSKILIVDDEPDVIEFLSYNFIKKGYIVEGAGNGMEGIAKVKSFAPDLIIPVGSLRCENLRKSILNCINQVFSDSL